jgi:hypothetical protein
MIVTLIKLMLCVIVCSVMIGLLLLFGITIINLYFKFLDLWK